MTRPFYTKKHIQHVLMICIAITCYSYKAMASYGLSHQDSLTIAKAEAEILKAGTNFTPTEEEQVLGILVPPHDDFINLIKSNPHTLEYPFQAIQKENYVNICTSEDGQLRYYSWDTGRGGTMINFSLIEQYRTPDGQVHVNAFTDEEFYTMVSGINTLKGGNTPTYLVRHYFRESTCHFSLSIEAVRIDEKGLHRPQLFEEADSLTNSLGIYCNSCDNSSQVEGYEEDFSYFYFYKGNQELFIAINEDRGTDYNIFTDQYRHYIFDGKIYRLKEIVSNPHLHPSLHEYLHFHQVFVTKEYRIRIDKMNDGTYRYASWKRPKKISEQPDIIILGGIYRNSGQFIFNNEGYTYIVDDVQSSSFDKYLTITKNKKQILREKKIDI